MIVKLFQFIAGVAVYREVSLLLQININEAHMLGYILHYSKLIVSLTCQLVSSRFC